jgi:hypothetical protein
MGNLSQVGSKRAQPNTLASMLNNYTELSGDRCFCGKKFTCTILLCNGLNCWDRKKRDASLHPSGEMNLDVAT